MLEMEHLDDDFVVVERLKLAAWMRLNGQELVYRRVTEAGKIVYGFRRSSETDALVRQWDEKTPQEVVLAKFSSLVSFEIQTAVRMRRAAGLPTRLSSSEKA